MTPLLTRRQTLQSLAFSAAFGGSLLSLAGCGGGGGHNGGGSGLKTGTSRIAVTLPAGFSIPTSDLVGGTSFGSGTVDATGFSAKVNPNAPTFAYLMQKSTGKLLMYGLVGEGRPGVTPLGTAALSLAFALGLTGLPPKTVAEGMALLEADPHVTGLAVTIETLLASDPYAVSTDNAAYTAAMKGAFDALNGASRGQAGRAAPRSRAEGDPLLQITPSDEQFGFRLNQGDSNQIVPTNVARKPAAVYTYRTGHVPSLGDAGVEAVNHQDLEPTVGVVGTLTSPGGMPPAYAPVEGKPVELPVSGDDDRTLYETIVLFPAATATDPDFFGDVKYAGEIAEWRAKRGELNQYSLFFGLIADIFKLGLGAASAAVGIQSGLALVSSHEFAAQAAGQAVIEKAVAGEFGIAISQALQLAVRQDLIGGSTRSIIRAVVTRATGIGAGVLTETSLIAAALAALTSLAISGAIVLFGDGAVGLYDLSGLPKGVVWNETVLKPKIKVTPREGEIRQGASLGLSVDPIAIAAANLTYTWTLTGSSYGTLTGAGGDGGSGKTITTTSTSVTLAVTPSDPDGQVVTVTVEARDKTTGKSLGSDQAKIKVVGNQPVTERATYKAQYYADSDSASVFGVVSFAEVKGATYYAIEGTGGNDPYYYHDHISVSYNPNDPFTASGVTVPFAVPLSRIGGSAPGDQGGWTAYMDGRFGGFTFTVTAYFGS